MKKIIFILSIITFHLSIASAQNANLDWARAMSGTGNDSYSIAVDNFGNTYTTGSLTGTVDFDPGGGVFNLTSTGSNDVFISKLDSSGNFVWAINIGGTNSELGRSIAVDGNGNVYIIGIFYGTADFDPGAGVFNLTSAGNQDVFIFKLDLLGSFLWAVNLGGVAGENGNSIAVDAFGNVYTTGSFMDTTDFDPGTGVFNLIASPIFPSIFVSKLDSSGNFLWAKNIGDVNNGNGGVGLSIALDSASNVYTTGNFSGTIDFNPETGTFNLTSSGQDDMFISKLNSLGNFLWAKKIGSVGYEVSRSIAIDASQNIYITGFFQEMIDFDPGIGIFNLAPAIGSDIFISKYDSSGNFLWVKGITATYGGTDRSIAIDAQDNVYTTGNFQGTIDFDPGIGVFNMVSNGDRDIFISTLDSSGNFLNALNMGGITADFGLSVTVDNQNNIYSTGSFSGTADFDPGAGLVNLTSNGPNDIFVLKLNQDFSLSTVDIKNRGNISIYPNPTSDQLMIKSNLIINEVKIMGVTGKTVKEIQLNPNINAIGVSDLSKGIYFIRLSDGKKSVTTKFIKN